MSCEVGEPGVGVCCPVPERVPLRGSGWKGRCAHSCEGRHSSVLCVRAKDGRFSRLGGSGASCETGGARGRVVSFFLKLGTNSVALTLGVKDGAVMLGVGRLRLL